MKNERMSLKSKITIGLLAAGMLVTASGVSLANANETYQVKKVERLQKQLTLTDDQTLQIKQILDNAKASRAANETISREERQAIREAHQARKAATQNEIRAILTPEQIVKYEEVLKNRAEKKQMKPEKNRQAHFDKVRKGRDS